MNADESVQVDPDDYKEMDIVIDTETSDATMAKWFEQTYEGLSVNVIKMLITGADEEVLDKMSIVNKDFNDIVSESAASSISGRIMSHDEKRVFQRHKECDFAMKCFWKHKRNPTNVTLRNAAYESYAAIYVDMFDKTPNANHLDKYNQCVNIIKHWKK